jgi:hypothetical protein
MVRVDQDKAADGRDKRGIVLGRFLHLRAICPHTPVDWDTSQADDFRSVPISITSARRAGDAVR